MSNMSFIEQVGKEVPKMSDKIARVCDRCGKKDILNSHTESNGMILVEGEGCYLLLMRDLKEKELSRPSFNLTNKHFCPECLSKAIEDWLKEVA